MDYFVGKWLLVQQSQVEIPGLHIDSVGARLVWQKQLLGLVFEKMGLWGCNCLGVLEGYVFFGWVLCKATLICQNVDAVIWQTHYCRLDKLTLGEQRTGKVHLLCLQFGEAHLAFCTFRHLTDNLIVVDCWFDLRLKLEVVASDPEWVCDCRRRDIKDFGNGDRITNIGGECNKKCAE